MTIRLSTGARNAMAGGIGLASAFNRGYMKIFSGSQPASADAAETGTNLGIVTAASGALTKEVRAVGTVTITAAASGTINTITVGGLNIIPDGAITADGTTAGTAVLLAEAINRNGMMQATVSGSVVSIRGHAGTGVTTAAVSGTLTTVTATYGNMASGTAPVNGLILLNSTVGRLDKNVTQVWSFNGINGPGTAAWFRFYSSDNADTGALLTAAPWYPRIDGTVGTSGADMLLTVTAITTGAPNTIDRFELTMPNP